MERKTIGSFISALRRANGMTQQDLADKLNVSNKAVSRWERDECAPDLSLIPVIAELFDITCDELLKGERIIRDEECECDEQTKQSFKSEKQFKNMLHNRMKKYKNLTLVSLGISVIGILAAAIANLAFSEGLVAFCIATAFIMIGEICQICFSANARLLTDEDDYYSDKIKEANTSVVKILVATAFVNLVAFSFCLPLVTMIYGVNYGLGFESWCVYGILYAVIAFVIAYILYLAVIRKKLLNRGVIWASEEQMTYMKKDASLLRKILAISTAVALVIGIVIFALVLVADNGWAAKREKFDTVEAFKSYMEGQYDEWYENGGRYYYYDCENNTIISQEPIDKDDNDPHPDKTVRRVSYRDGSGYFEFYYNPRLYYDISFTDSDDSIDRMPATVITKYSYYEAKYDIDYIISILSVLIAIDYFSAAVVYAVKKVAMRRKYSAK